MNAAFRRRITVLVGLGTPRSIESAGEALAYLLELPSGARDEAFEATVAACRDALRGLCDADEARDVFCAFARRRDVYMEDVPTEDALADVTADIEPRSLAA